MSKLTDQCLTTELASSPVVSNTPARLRRNTDYSPGTAVALMAHIKWHVFDENLIAIEPRFTKIFLNKAPPLDRVQAMDLETSLGFTFKELVAQISNASAEKDMYPPIARLFSALTLLVNVDQDDWCLSLPPDKLWMTIKISTCAPLAASNDHPSNMSDLGSVPAMEDSIREFVKSAKRPSSFILDWGSMCSTSEARKRCMPTKDSNATFGEKTQAVSYAWSCLRHQVNCSGFLAFYACLDGVQLIWYGVSRVKISPSFKWDDFNTLFSFIYVTHRKENMLEDTRLRLGLD